MAGDGSRWDDEGPVVSVAWLRAHLGDSGVQVVDARPFADYAAGHIPGAVNVDLYALKLLSSATEAVAEFEDRAGQALRRSGMRSDARVIFYEEITGASAARGVWLLDYLGHRGGALLDGGLVAWAEAGGEITRAIPPTVPSDLALTPDRATFASAADVLAAIGGAPATLLDTRGDREYAAGTIPGSIHLEWTRQLTPRGALRSPASLRALYAEAGVTPDPNSPVVTYCASGFRAAHAYVVLRALGYPAVRNYAPSWGEWARRGDRLVEVPTDNLS